MTLKTLNTSDCYSRIPAEGIMIAVFAGRILVERYRKEADTLSFPGAEQLQHEYLLRLHCFDQDTEYRLLVTDDGDRPVEVILNAEEEKEMEPDLLFEDEMLLRGEYCTDSLGIRRLRIVNRYRYTKFDTMTLDNYRISLWTA